MHCGGRTRGCLDVGGGSCVLLLEPRDSNRVVMFGCGAGFLIPTPLANQAANSRAIDLWCLLSCLSSDVEDLYGVKAG